MSKGSKKQESGTSKRSKVEGPEKPWPKDLDRAAEEFVDFLQNSESKHAVKDFIIDAYKKFESEKVARIMSRVENEEETNKKGASDFHQAGNIAPVLHEDFNMSEVEDSFVRSLRSTRESLVRSVEDRVEDINRLLANIGGFSAQLKGCFARSTVVFFEQDDPKYSFRERLIFSVNLPNYELKRPWNTESLTGKVSRNKKGVDGRTDLQMTWDDAVNSLAKIVESTGLKPKYCKNDRNYGRFVMKQDLRSRVNLPDEYFSFTLDYNTEEKIKEMCVPYNKIVDKYEKNLKKLNDKIQRYPSDSTSARLSSLKKKHLFLSQERDFFVGTTPDPNQLEEGLLFLIEVTTLKDYHIVKDRMQSIMTRYILFLSKIATKEASADKELVYQLSKAERSNQGDTLSEADVHQSADFQEFSEEVLDKVPHYAVKTSLLKSVPDSAKSDHKSMHLKKKKAS